MLKKFRSKGVPCQVFFRLKGHSCCSLENSLRMGREARLQAEKNQMTSRDTKGLE